MEERFFRGEMYYIRPYGDEIGSEQRAGRPAIIVSNDKCNEHSPVVEIVYLTTQVKNSLPTHVDVQAERPSIALCEQVNSISKSRISQFIGKCTDREMAMIDGALCVSLGIELGVVSSPIPAPHPISTKKEQDEETIALKREISIWKELYHGLLDRVI